MILKHGPYIADTTAEDDEFHGVIPNISDIVDLYAKDLKGLWRAFAASIKVYEDSCRERGLEPNKHYSGKFALRFTDPELHRRANLAAHEKGMSVNAYLNQLVEDSTSS